MRVQSTLRATNVSVLWLLFVFRGSSSSLRQTMSQPDVCSDDKAGKGSRTRVSNWKARSFVKAFQRRSLETRAAAALYSRAIFPCASTTARAPSLRAVGVSHRHWMLDKLKEQPSK